MTEICGDEERPKMADKRAGETRDTVVALLLLVASMALIIWYFVKLALGDALGAEKLELPAAIVFFCSVGFDQSRRTTSPAVHVLTKANWALMAVFALTVIVPVLLS